MAIETQVTPANQPGRRFFGMGLDRLSLLSNAVFFVLSAGALIAAILVFFVARASERAKDREISTYKADADVAISQANSHAERAIAEAAKANLEILKLKSPRSINEQDGQKIIEDCSRFQGTKYDIAVTEGDTEARILMFKLIALLEKAGWEMKQWTGNEFGYPHGDKPRYGAVQETMIKIVTDPQNALSAPAARALAAALSRSGLQTVSASGPSMDVAYDEKRLDPNLVHIVVGRKYP